MIEGPFLRAAFAGPVTPFGLRAAPPLTWRARLASLDITVDLGRDLFSARWWRGLGTLMLLTGSVALLAPDLGPLPAGRPAPLRELEAEQWRAIGIAPLAAGSATGLPMAETALVEPLSAAPERSSVALFATYQKGDSLAALLGRSGTSADDAARAADLIADAAPQLAPGTTLSLTLGQRRADGTRPIQQLALRASLALRLRIERVEGALSLVRLPIAVDSTPLRLRGRAGDGLYWSLRSSGVSPAAAGEYLRALASRIEVGSMIMPDDRFDLVIANRRAETGETQEGALLYAGLDRRDGTRLQMMRWPVGGQMQWTEASGFARGGSSGGLGWPVQARITSGFGMRVHPILRFARMHRGIDFGARWGQPIVAAADGRVVRAGWSGGYGNQVRVAHAGGLTTSYSHMSRIVAPPGGIVRQGQLIGYVGSTGLSTGPHLHYEVLRDGVAINPMGVRFNAPAQIDGQALGAFRARMAALLGG